MAEILRKYRSLIVTVLLLIFSLTSLYSHHQPQEERSAMERATVWLTTPIQKAIVYIWAGVGIIWDSYFDLVDARQLAGENGYLLTLSNLRIRELEAVESENARLRRLLEFKQRHPYKYLPARIIGTDILGQFRTITINIGADDGVPQLAPVVNGDGVVGRIYALSSHSARVLLIIDQNSSVDGVILRTRSRGIIQGNASDERLECKFAYSLRTEDIEVGDEIVTSGIDRSFPPGMPLGRVEQVFRSEGGIFQDAIVHPAVDFTRLEEIMVLISTETQH